jgi:xanthine dehydrogenase accessory factor
MSAVGQRPSGSRGIFAEIVRLQRAGQRAVLATPLWHTGSVPLSAESKLLYRADGSIAGTVGGGLLEARVIEIARQVLAEGKAQILEFELTQDQASRTGMICGGRCAVLVEPIEPGRDAAVYATVAKAIESRQPVVVVTLLSASVASCRSISGDATKLALLPDGPGRRLREACDGGLGAHGSPRAQPRGNAPSRHTEDLPETLLAIAEDVLKAGHPQVASVASCRSITDPIRAHFDPITPRPTVFVFGAGHVAIPVAHIAALAGFRIVVVDDRAEFANRERFPGADDVIVASVDDAFSRITVDETGYVVAITRGHAMDEEVVAHALRTSARYIGMIGSKRKVAGVLSRLRTQGFTDADLARVHAPIGVDINAETVEEIAVSIVAELIAVRRGET